MVIKRVDPTSCAKVAAVLYGLIGVVLGAIVSLLALVSAGTSPGGEGGALGVLFGAAAIVVLPILYAGIGTLAILVVVWLYNLVAGWVGGIVVEME